MQFFAPARERKQNIQAEGRRLMSIDVVNSSLAAAVNQVYQTTPRTNAAAVEGASDKAVGTEDTLTLSPEAEKALELPWLFGVEPGKPITLADMQAFAAEQLNSFRKGFQAMLRGNDIDTSQPVTLGHEFGSGRLIVTNDHPDAEKIEGLLEERPDLRNMYTGATNALALAKHGEEHTKFAEAYAQNPQAAVAQYSYLFNSTWDASVTFSGDSYEVAYDRVFRQ
jgi:hypothetical protein